MSAALGLATKPGKAVPSDEDIRSLTIHDVMNQNNAYPWKSKTKQRNGLWDDPCKGFPTTNGQS